MSKYLKIKANKVLNIAVGNRMIQFSTIKTSKLMNQIVGQLSKVIKRKKVRSTLLVIIKIA